MSQTNVRPTIILVPGAWHSASTFSTLIAHLQAAGYAVHAVDLPSVGAEPALPDFAEDVTAIGSSLSHAIDGEGRDVVLVLHSYGGIPGSDAAEIYSKSERMAKGLCGGIVRIVWISAFACDVGESMLDKVAGKKSSNFVRDDTGHITTTESAHLFYNDLDPSSAAYHVSLLRSQSAGVFTSKQSYAAWKHIPSTYVVCELDNCNPVEHQERMASQEGGLWEVVRLRAGHSPFLSMPREVAEIVGRAGRGDW